MTEKILVWGSAAREHALLWKLAQSPTRPKLYTHPGNAGTRSIAESFNVDCDPLDAAEEENIDMIIFGPERPIVEGLADEARRRGFAVLAPTQEAALITEGSKIRAKEFMDRHHIPTAPWWPASDPIIARRIAQFYNDPMVVKADGLCEGKGVFVSETIPETFNAIDECLVQDKFGSAGRRIVLEKRLSGQEISFFILANGQDDWRFLGAVMDYKRRADHNQGPNTGGLGCHTLPKWLFNEYLFQEISSRIVEPTLKGLAEEGITYQGILYFGLMVVGIVPFVLEYNCRFGAPETELLVRLWSDDIGLLLKAMALAQPFPKKRVIFSDQQGVCVVITSPQYPYTKEYGGAITGLKEAESIPGVVIYHGNTMLEDGRLIARDGRILSITALAATLAEARCRAYEAVACIRFQNGLHYRLDIGL